MQFPIAFRNPNSIKELQIILAADVGATKTHLAMYQFSDGEMYLIRDEKFPSQAYPSFETLLKKFEWHQPKPDALSIAFAGPIFNGRAKATNLDWEIDVHQLSKQLNLANIYLLNDLEANAYGLAGLKKKDIKTIQKGNPKLKGNAAIISPGTGLGEAGMYWDGESLHPFATEGGHSDFAARTAFDNAFQEQLRKRYGHVSWERVLSGSGIWTIYEFLRRLKGKVQPAWLREECETNDNALVVSHGARLGDPICKQAMDLFFQYLAIEASNLVVKYKATGGLFIGGGIVPKNIELLDTTAFLSHFHSMGRFRSMMEQVPVHIILNEQTALLGAAYFGALSPDKVDERTISDDSRNESPVGFQVNEREAVGGNKQKD